VDSVAPSGSRYRVFDELGRGGMGVVRRVLDTERQELVALKTVLRRDPASRIRLKREFRVIRDLRHPGLVRLHDLGENEEGPFFTMELIEGIDVLSYCWGLNEARTAPPGSSEKTAVSPAVPHSEDFAALEAMGDEQAPPPVDWARLGSVLGQVVEALGFLHAAGVVHRDLKPSNAMVTREGRVKLLDFGVLAQLGEGGDGVLGTAGYAAPEQLDGAAVGPAADLYALGAMIFQIVSGRPVR
jgi:serine/threonine protein kinase